MQFLDSALFEPNPQAPFLPYTVFSQLNAGGVYFKLGLVDPAFIRTRRLFGARRLFIECIFRPFSAIHFFYHHYWKFSTKTLRI